MDELGCKRKRIEMKRGKLFFLCFFFLSCLITACGQGTSDGASINSCKQASTIKGTVVTISRVVSGKTTGSLFLDSTKEKQADFQQAVVTINSSTQFFAMRGDSCPAISFASLKQGQRVQIQSTGVALQSSPPQIEATAVILLPA